MNSPTMVLAYFYPNVKSVVVLTATNKPFYNTIIQNSTNVTSFMRSVKFDYSNLITYAPRSGQRNGQWCNLDYKIPVARRTVLKGLRTQRTVKLI